MTIQRILDDQIGEQQPDGLFTRAASYGASIANAYFFDELSLLNNVSYEHELKKIIAIERTLVSSLRALNIIGFFSIAEWLDTTHQGRLMLILLYLEQNPHDINEKIRHKIQAIYPTLHSTLKIIIDNLLPGKRV